MGNGQWVMAWWWVVLVVMWLCHCTMVGIGVEVGIGGWQVTRDV